MVEKRAGTGRGLGIEFTPGIPPSSVKRRMRPIIVGLMRQDLGSMA